MLQPWRRIRSMARLRRHIEAAATASVRPDEDERFLEVGPNPFRVLLIGSGSAVGYGVAHRRDALDGRMAVRLAAALGRGVTVTNVSRHDSTLAGQLQLARLAIDYGSADLVLWCPSFVEIAGPGSARAWSRRLTQLLDLTTSRAVLVLELPTPVGEHDEAVTAAPIIARINERLRRVARRTGGIATVAPPPVQVRPLGEPLFDAEYYDRLGAVAAAAAVGLVGPARSAPAQPGTPSRS